MSESTSRSGSHILATFDPTPLRVLVNRRAAREGVKTTDYCTARGFNHRQLYRPMSLYVFDRICVRMGLTPYQVLPRFDILAEESLPPHGTGSRYQRPYGCRCEACVAANYKSIVQRRARKREQDNRRNAA